jgi:hypothetical protein
MPQGLHTVRALSNIKIGFYLSNFTKAMKLNISKNEISTIIRFPFSKMPNGYFQVHFLKSQRFLHLVEKRFPLCKQS